MSDTAIVADKLAKKYAIGVAPPRHDTLRDQIADSWRHLFRRNGSAKQARETFWALQDVSFEVKQGEVVGIIGPNGAGKTTLLRILSRITEPTGGKAIINGRVGSLLEVGTGFHPELTGRENVYLNGVILGMTRAEISRKFDEIVAFAEVEKFIDTPVKRYSTGMLVRLAFSVAAHLDPEVLLVDEVLAVGDASFQRKCLGKMEEVGRGGRTVLFVSHNMAAVDTLCERGVVLNHGRIVADTSASEAIWQYTHLMQSNATEAPPQNNLVSVHNLRVLGSDDGVLEPGHDATVTFTLGIKEPLRHPQLLLVVRGDEGLVIHDLVNSEDLPGLTQQGTFKVEVRFPPLWLREGLYSCHIKVMGETPATDARCISDPAALRVIAPDNQGYEKHGLLCPPTVWNLKEI